MPVPHVLWLSQVHGAAYKAFGKQNQSTGHSSVGHRYLGIRLSCLMKRHRSIFRRWLLSQKHILPLLSIWQRRDKWVSQFLKLVP